jgi:hypothetical protein
MSYEIEYFNHEIDDYCYIDVDFEGEVQVGNDGIGSYEFWGYRGYDHGVDYLYCENITWDKSKYTDNENYIIEKYLEKNFDKIENEICHNYSRI